MNTFFKTISLGIVTLTGACLSDSGGDSPGPGPDECTAADVVVTGALFHDARTAEVKDSALVNLGRAPVGELPSSCQATVVIATGAEVITLVETQPGQYEAGYSELVAGLPELTLMPGSEHELRVDLGSDGSVDIAGVVMLSDIDDFRVTNATAGSVTFAWDDAGTVADTMYYVQASDERDFVFPENFATGYVDGATTLRFGGDSEWRYFETSATCYARIQAETTGTLDGQGRFTAWEWPLEPILEY